MKNQRLNRLILGMLVFGFLFTFMTQGAVNAARKRFSEAAAPVQAAESAAGVFYAEAHPEAGTAPKMEEHGPGAGLKRNDGAGADAETIGHAGPGTAIRSGQTKYEEFKSKFEETERAIEKLTQSAGSGTGGVARKNAAASQLRYWETQMNSLYQTILDRLSKEEAAVLARDQQDWKKQRDDLAAEAVRNSAGEQQNSAGYTLTRASATRDRAYELLERYKDIL